MLTLPQVMQHHALDRRKMQIRFLKLLPRQLHLESAHRLTLRRKLLTIRLNIKRWTTRLPWTRLFTWYQAAGSAVAGAMFRLTQAIQDSSKTQTELTALVWEQAISSNVSAHRCVVELPPSSRQAISQPSPKVSPTIRQPTDRTLSSRGKYHFSFYCLLHTQTITCLLFLNWTYGPLKRF